MQSGTVLQHMHAGIRRLELEMEEKEHVARMLELEKAGELHGPDRIAMKLQESLSD